MSNLACLTELSGLTKSLDRFFSDNRQATDILADWMRMQFHPVQVYALVSQIIKNPTLLAEVSARSYLHGNGFLKVVLLDRGYKLRLHVWFAGQACEENIHDHRWSFASTILAGTLTSEIWQDSCAADVHALSLQEYCYHAAQDGQPASKTAVGTCAIRRTDLVEQAVGQAYVMPEQRLHRIINHGDQLVATMVCTAPTGQGTTRLIPICDQIEPDIQPPRLSPLQLKAALSQFLSLYLLENQA